MRAVKQVTPKEDPSSSSPTLIRSADPDDVPILVSLAEGTRVFTPSELLGLAEDFEAYHQGKFHAQDQMLTCEQAGRAVGFAHYGPAEITDGTWYLYWIAVDRESHGQGFGARLLQHVEDLIRVAGGRLALIETSMLPRYDSTRRFYLRQGYRRECVIRDFYSPGDHKAVFSKHL